MEKTILSTTPGCLIDVAFQGGSTVLVEELLKSGKKVRVFDKLYFGKKALSGIIDEIELVQGDIQSFDPSILDGIEAVVHLAGLSNDPTAEFNPPANMAMNALGTGNLARMCKEKGIRRFTYASSCSIYDRGLEAEDILQDETAEVTPIAAYAVSKYKGERALLELTDEGFCPVILRQGTVYGFSPRMRYDLVVNTFVKSALLNGNLTVFCGGQIWRPLVDVVDVAKAHIACLEADESTVKGNIFNVSYDNYKILDLAYEVRDALEGIDVEIQVDQSKRRDRSYRASTDKIERVLGFKHSVSVAESVARMAERIRECGYTDFSHPRYYNINWMMLLTEVESNLKKMGAVF